MLIDLIGTLAPTLGRMLGGPLGESVIKIMSESLKVQPTEKAIADAIKSNPEIAAQHLAYLEQWAVAESNRYLGTAENARLTHEAYKRELERGGFWSWLRPASGWVTIAQSVFYTALVGKHAWLGDFTILVHVPMMILAMTPTAALAGVYFWNRSQERQAMLDAPPQQLPLSQVGNAIRDTLSGKRK